MEAAISVSHLSKRFDGRLAFDDVSFDVGKGEVFGFLGPNGAGKTTTVRVLGTLIAPTSGSATVAGIPLTPENGVEIRRRIAIMPESPGLYVRLTVRENLECFADLYEVPDPGATHRPGAGRGQPGRPSPRRLRHPVQGPAPAGRARPGRCSATRRCCSSTSRRRGSTRSPRARSTSSSTGSASRG